MARQIALQGRVFQPHIYEIILEMGGYGWEFDHMGRTCYDAKNAQWHFLR